MTRTDRAVVIGASITGLVAARVLSEFFERVTVLERDHLCPTVVLRRGVPQSRHAHGLLARGREIFEELFPGLSADLIAQGAVTGDIQADVRWYNDGRRLRPACTGLHGLGVSRALLESHLRARIGAVAGIEIISSHHAIGLLAESDCSRVRGVRALAGTGGDAVEVTPADLVVDATGRGSRSPAWLEELGYQRPAMDRIGVQTVYATRHYRRKPWHIDGDLGVLVGAVPPGLPRGGAVLALEGDRWVVSLVGIVGEEPPLDPDGFAAFAATLAAPDVAELLRDAEPVDEPIRARFPASVRYRYEALRRFPEGFLVLGDAISCFNPVYGQGMTIAAAEALLLRECLRRGYADLAPRFFRRAARLINVPWVMATGNDLRFPDVEGHRPLRLRVVNRYLARLHIGAEHDPAIGHTFLRVANLLVRPERLLAPDIGLRILRANICGSHQPTQQ